MPTRARTRSWQLAWPLILSNLSVPMLGVVDTAAVGHLDAPHHLGAVALGATMMGVIYFLFGFLRTGTTALAAQALGAGDTVELRAVLARGLLVAVIVGFATLAAAPLILRLSVTLFAPTPEVLAEYRTYLGLRCLGAPAALASFAVLGWLLGLQDARRPLVIMLATNALNAVLDVVLVFGFGMAAGGVALATVVAEHAGLVLGLVLIRGTWRRQGGWPGAARVLVAARIGRLLAVNRDLFLRSTMLEGAFLTLTALSSRQGEVVLAANGVLLNFFTTAAYGLDGFAHAAEAMVGRAAGARDLGAFKAAVRAGFLNATLLAAAMTLLFAGAGPAAVRLMTDLPEVRAAALAALPWVVLLPLVSVWAFLFDGVFFGTTRTAELRDGMALALVLFAGAVAVLEPLLGNHGLWLAFVLFMAGRGLILALIYRRSPAFNPA